MKTFFRLILGIIFITSSSAVITSCSTDSIDEAVEGEQETNSLPSSKRDKDKNGDPIDSDGGAEIPPERIVGHKWRKVSEIRGTKSMKSKTFKIKGKEWKVNWVVEEKGDDNGEFIVILHNKKDKNDTEIIAQQTGSGPDFAPFEGGQGEYYLEITSSQPYSIEIQEYK